MAFDAHKNFAHGTVVTAPSPATSGTSIVLSSGDGALMPAVPFNAVIAPSTPQEPNVLNSEVVRVTARPGAADTFTIARAQEGSTARTVIAGDRLYAGITSKTLTDVESATYQSIGFRLDDPTVGGAPPNGTDDTATFNAVWASCLAANGVPMVLPPNTNYIYNGSGLDNGTVRSGGIIGAEPGVCKVTITQDTASLFKPSQRYDRFIAKDFSVLGGFGLYRNTNTGPQVARRIKFDNVEFSDYVGCAIASETNDSPYLTVTRCYFNARDYATSMGISWAGHNDNMFLAANAFVRNRISVKLVWDETTGKAPANGYIVDNDFIRFSPHSGTDPHAINLWIVPTPATNNVGNIYIDGNKFGSENLIAGDLWVLFADELSGSDHATRFPDESTSSTGSVFGIMIGSHNTIADSGTAGSPVVDALVYSTTTDVRHCEFAGCSRGAPPLYLLKLKDNPAPSTSAATAAGARYNQTNILGPYLDDTSGISVVTVRGCNYPGMGVFVDPWNQQGVARTVENVRGGMAMADYVDLLSGRLSTYSLSGAGATNTPITDRVGGNDAAEFSLPTNGMARHILGSFTPGVPVFIDFECKAGATSPIATLNLNCRVGPGGAGNFHFTRFGIEIPASGWTSYRFWFVPREAGPIEIQFINGTGATGTVQLGRVNVYHAREPVSHGPYMFRSPGGTEYIAGVDNTGALTGVTANPAAGTYAPINNAALTGNPTAPTPAAGDNDTSIATTFFVKSEPSPGIDIITGWRGTGAVNGAVWPLANTIVFVRLFGSGSISNLLIDPTVLSGNFLIAVYANSGSGRNAVPTGNPIISTASAPMSSMTVNTIQTLPLGGTVTGLTPGSHWGALCIDNVVAAVARETMFLAGQAAGIAKSLAQASIAAPTATGTGSSAYFPWMQAT